ncbi:MAG: BCAM0308 family protein [Armatimonadota bacterium]
MIPRENKLTRSFRRKVESYNDPYIPVLKPQEVAVCRECHSVYAGQRWELESQAAHDLANAKCIVDTICPACQKIRDRQPGGIVTLSGSFLQQHEDEIVSMVQNENQNAMMINPLERIMDIDRSDGSMIIQTTNEKLAQKLGRAMHKSYSGEVEYKWSKGTKLVRVNWHRD